MDEVVDFQPNSFAEKNTPDEEMDLQTNSFAEEKNTAEVVDFQRNSFVKEKVTDGVVDFQPNSFAKEKVTDEVVDFQPDSFAEKNTADEEMDLQTNSFAEEKITAEMVDFQPNSSTKENTTDEVMDSQSNCFIKEKITYVVVDFQQNSFAEENITEEVVDFQPNSFVGEKTTDKGMDFQPNSFAREDTTKRKNMKIIKHVIINIPEESFDIEYTSRTVNDNGGNRCEPIRENVATLENIKFKRTKVEGIVSYQKNERCKQSESQCKINFNDHVVSNIQENMEDKKTQEVLKKIVLRNEFNNFKYVTATVVGNANDALEVECDICFVTIQSNEIIGCSTCKTNFCENCLQSHIKTKLLNGAIKVRCPGNLCNSRNFSEQLIGAFAKDMLPLYMKNHVELSKDPTKKTCPNCHKIEVNESTKLPMKKKILCANCRFEWCFLCYAPWHNEVTCEEYKQYSEKQDLEALQSWAKKYKTTGITAMKCPECKFYIEKISGCNNMTCTRCKKCFCYKCGDPKRFGICTCTKNNIEQPTRIFTTTSSNIQRNYNNLRIPTTTTTTTIRENSRRNLCPQCCQSSIFKVIFFWGMIFFIFCALPIIVPTIVSKMY